MRGEQYVSKSAGKMALSDDPMRRVEKYKDGAEDETKSSAGVSIFDPVLCELAYRWFCPENGTILDPFAGGSVRGIVASKLNRQYIGVELRAEQVEANRTQAKELCSTDPLPPIWHIGDSRNIGKLTGGATADLMFSCPPYADLEVYSNNPQDLSTLKYSKFIEAYRIVIAESLKLLKPDRFSCFVVGDIRDDKGFYQNFVSDTIAAFQDGGSTLYNEAILVTAIGSLPMRVGKQFRGGRKLGKTHQNVLIFYNGDPRNIAAIHGEVVCSVEDPADEFGEVL
ncbi:MAG: DNA methyltransferase [Leptolyngbyaceae cyanobacterium CSU_1_4]|nr:DNA methyltransferase [Leptolyngbyaceae cyanobacterium CSU_1_4]